MEPSSPARYRVGREVSPEGRDAPLGAGGTRRTIRQKGGMIGFVGFVMLAFVFYNVGEVRTAGLQQQAARADAVMRAVAPHHGQEALQDALERTGVETEEGRRDSIAPGREGIRGARKDVSEDVDEDDSLESKAKATGSRKSKATETDDRDGAEEREEDTLGKSEDRGDGKFAVGDDDHNSDGGARMRGDGADVEEGGQEGSVGEEGSTLSPTNVSAKELGRKIPGEREETAVLEDGKTHDGDADGGRPTHRDDDNQNLEKESTDEEVQIQGDLLEWLRKRGAEVGPVSLGRFNHSGMLIRGLQAGEDLSAGAVVFRIPEELILSPFDLDWEGQYGSKGLVEGDELPDGMPPQDLLSALRIAEERALGGKSRWRTYLQMLPSMSDFKTFHPLMAAEKDLKEWEKLPTMRKVLDVRHRISKEFKRWRLGRFFSWKELWYCFVIGTSRAYNVHKPNSTDDVTVSALVPGVDMCNTDVAENINTGWRHHRDRNVFVLEALRGVKAGEELLQAYQDSSKKDNADLALMFGMELHGNPVKVPRIHEQSVCRKLVVKPDLKKHSSKLTTLLHALALQHCQTSGASQQLVALGRKGEEERDSQGDGATDKAGATDKGGGALVPVPVNSKIWPYYRR